MSYKRLTTKKYGTYLASCENCGYNNPSFDCDAYSCKQVLIKRLAELEDKIENGTLIELPCNIGDTVYYVSKKGIEPFIICAIVARKVRKNDIGIDFQFTDIQGNRKFNYMFYDTCLGDDFFLTKAEAEKKLEELSKNP